MKEYTKKFNENCLIVLPENNEEFLDCLVSLKEKDVRYNVGAVNISESFLDDYRACIFVFRDKTSIKKLMKERKLKIIIKE